MGSVLSEDEIVGLIKIRQQVRGAGHGHAESSPNDLGNGLNESCIDRY